ncbi:uncharacterized protein RJT21DRAFT_26090 [Scheffersomyces amazonensis]|uniref:uncharacterized protein n=1 Tax=Scheffersomyces amazonensis TaxID=1078765 RepID=UPI00315CEE97
MQDNTNNNSNSNDSIGPNDEIPTILDNHTNNNINHSNNNNNPNIGLSTFPTIHKNISTSNIILNGPGINQHPHGRRNTTLSLHPSVVSSVIPVTIKPSVNRTRSVSSSLFPSISAQNQPQNDMELSNIPDTSRNHSNSINSIASVESTNSVTLNNIIKQDANPYYKHFRPSIYNKYGKVKLIDDIDIEKQLIISAGGKREYLMGFILKLLFLTLIVIGSAVLIFYAL